MHTRGPRLKVASASGSLAPSREAEWSHLWGLNLSASGPQVAGLRWIMKGMRLRVVPAGMSVLAMIMGWVVVRGMERAGVEGVSLCLVFG